jgi:hypothetical protein
MSLGHSLPSIFRPSDATIESPMQTKVAGFELQFRQRVWLYNVKAHVLDFTFALF